LISNKKRMTAA